MTTPRRKLTVKKDAFSAVVARLCDCHASTPYQVENMGRGIFHLSPGPIAAGVHSWESYREISREAWAVSVRACVACLRVFTVYVHSPPLPPPPPQLFDRKLDLIYTDEVAYYVWLQEVFADGDGGERDHVLRQVRTIHERFMLSGPTLCKISLLFCSKLDRMLGDLVDPADFGRESVSCSPSIMLDVVASRMVGDMLVLVADAAPLDKAFMFADFCASPIVMMEAMHKCDAFEAAWRADARAHLRKALTAQAHANTRRRDADAAAAALIAEEEVGGSGVGV